ncbi:hypothetical protein BDZ91DRAFT_715133 [Kalaharituber pfeilii]|nr:hypothetical protein BDZ91DRAFT_715133 [Kalaharituber pfeilii]
MDTSGARNSSTSYYPNSQYHQYLQATPATSANCLMKIFQTTAEGTVLEYKLSFTSPTNARGELEDLKKALTVVIQAHKHPTPAAGSTLAPGAGANGGSGTPAALAIASAMGGSRGKDVWSDARLQADGELQQELLKHNPELGRTFLETVATGSITAAQFWSTRTHLLRAFAIERSQTKGAYNVLATMKPKTVDNAIRISLSREQIQDIFRQHPLVKKVYDENVPKITEGDFWRRFFSSRLFKKLKGEKILPGDGYDDIVDAYLNAGGEVNSRKKQKIEAIPNFINLEGNEQHTQAKGNRPDMTMRPEKIENVPLIRTLNNISMKIVDSVTPIDKGFNENRAMEELGLADLRGEAEIERIILNIQDQRRFFADREGREKKEDISVSKDPSKVLRRLRNSLGGSGSMDLAAAAAAAAVAKGKVSKGEEIQEGQIKLQGHLVNATDQIAQAIIDRRNHLYDAKAASHTIVTGVDLAAAPTIDLMRDIPRSIHDALTLTHATTTEFLHHFWLAFLSGDERRAPDLQTLVGSLRRSHDRMEAVAKQAEEEREKEKELRRQAALAEYKATGRKRRKGADDNILVSRKLVEDVMRPTVKAVGYAVMKWEEAVREAETAAGSTPV